MASKRKILFPSDSSLSKVARVIDLAYHKQGDDFQNHFDASKDVVSALKAHADMLRNDAQVLLRLANFLDTVQPEQRKSIDITGDTHTITISLPVGLKSVFDQLKLSQPEPLSED